jgi:hypothetical protein
MVNMDLRVPRLNTLRRRLWDLNDPAVERAHHRWLATEADLEGTLSDVSRARAEYDRLYEKAATRAAMAWRREQHGAHGVVAIKHRRSVSSGASRQGRRPRAVRRRGAGRGSTGGTADGDGHAASRDVDRAHCYRGAHHAR